MIILLTAILVAWLLWYYYNKIVGAGNRAQRAWADVLVYERQKIKVLDALEEQASSFKIYESNVLEKVVGLRSALGRLPEAASGEALKSTQMATRELVGGLNMAFEAYPELKAAGIVSGLMKEIVEQQANIAAAVTVFNRTVEEFNNCIQMFPSSMVNTVINKKQVITPFSDKEAAASFDYKPNF
ncbi:LemA family protein [Pseudomonas chlororaphis]